MDMTRDQTMEETAARISERFVARLRKDLTDEEWAEMRRVNAVHGVDAPICASHDYVDANMYMWHAFEDVLGREMDLTAMGEWRGPGEHPDAVLVNDAWTRAKRDHLTEA